VLCLVPVGLLVDRFGGKIVNVCGIGLWSLATVGTGLAPSHLVVMGTRIVMAWRVNLLARGAGGDARRRNGRQRAEFRVGDRSGT